MAVYVDSEVLTVSSDGSAGTAAEPAETPRIRVSSQEGPSPVYSSKPGRYGLFTSYLPGA